MDMLATPTGGRTPTGARTPTELLTPVDKVFKNVPWEAVAMSNKGIDGLSSKKTWESARTLFLKKVEDEEGSLKKVDEGLLKDTASPKDAIDVCIKVKDRAESEYTKGYVTVGSTKLFLKEKLTRILKKIQTFVVFGDATMNYNPESTALVWAAVRIVLQCVLDDMELCGFLVDSCDEIASAMFVGEVYEKRYARLCERNAQAPAIDSDGDVSIALKIAGRIPYLYSEILYFSYQAKRYIGHRGKLTRALRNMLKQPLIKLKSTLDAIVKIKAEISQIAGMEYQEASMALLKSVHEDEKKNAELIQLGFEDMHATSAFLKESIFTANKDIQDIKELITKSTDKDEQKKLQEQYDKNMNWLDPLDDFYAEAKKGLDSREKGTCKWLLKKQNYKKWFSDPECRLLWLHGEVGSGKTTIMSFVTDKVKKKLKKQAAGGADDASGKKSKKKKSKKDGRKIETVSDANQADLAAPKLLVFFCKTGDDATQTTESILLNLIAQVYKYCQSKLSSFPELLQECNEKINALQKNEKEGGASQIKKARGKHNMTELQRLLTSFANVVKGEFYVIIDAVDECTDRESAKLLSILKSLSEADKRFKILVSSRPEPDIEEEFGQESQITVGVKQNTDDIKAFVVTELKKISNLTDEERAEAPKEIAKRAAGMFRYAALAVESLKQPWQRPIRSHLKSFPGVADLYQRNIEQLTPQHRVLLLTAIRWTLLADRPVVVTQVAEDYNGIFKAVDFGQEKGEKDDTMIQITEAEDDSDEDETDEDEDEESSDESDSDEDSEEDEGSEDEGEVQEETATAPVAPLGTGEEVNPTEIEPTEEIADKGEEDAQDQSGDTLDDAVRPKEGEEEAQEELGDEAAAEDNADEEEDEEAKHEELLADDVRHIKAANSVFLRVLDSNVMEFRHASAKEFILESAEKGLKLRSETLCNFCLERMSQVSAIDCAPKMGHLKLAITCLQHLNNSEFQRRYLLSQYPDSDVEEDDDDEEEEETKEDNNEEASAEDSKQTATEENTESENETKEDDSKVEGADNVPNGDKGANDKSEHGDKTVTLLALDTHQDEQDHVEITPEISLTSPSVASISESIEDAFEEARKADASLNQDTNTTATVAEESKTEDDDKKNKEPDTDHLTVDNALDHRDEVESVDTDYNSVHEWTPEAKAEETKVLRYEIEKWYIHFREADKLWTEEEKSKDDDWKLLYRLVDKFMLDSPAAFKAWQKATLFPFWNLWKQLDPLCTAVALNIPTLVDRFIAKGMDPNKGEGEGGVTAIFFAAWLSNGSVIKKLLDAGAHVNAVLETNTAKDRPIDWAVWCPAGDHSDIIKILIDAGATVDFPERHGKFQSPLHWAANRNMVEGCKAMLEKGANVNVKDSIGETPMHWCLTNPAADFAVVQVLLDYKANVNEEDNESQRPLYEACMTDNPKIVKRVIDAGAEINDPDIFGVTALHIACQYGYTKVVEVLVDAGADILHRDNRGKTPLAKAVDYGRIEVVQYLLPKYAEKDPDSEFLLIKDNRGRTICHKAAAKGYENIISEILKYGDAKKTLSARDYKLEAIPLHAAAFRNWHDCLKVMVEAGADPSTKNAAGDTPLELAYHGWAWNEGNDYEAIFYLMRKCPQEIETIKKILFLGAGNNAEILKAVLDLGVVDIHEKDPHGWNSMLRASQVKEKEVIEILLAHGAEVIDLEVESKTFPNDKLGFRPSKMDEAKKGDWLTVSEDGMVISRGNDPTGEAYSVLADHPFPAGQLVHYWEVEILPGGDDECTVGIGFGSRYQRLNHSMPGWRTLKNLAYGYHSDDGKLFSSEDNWLNGEAEGLEYGPTWTHGDTVGCIIDMRCGKAMYTKNGEFLGVAFRGIGDRRQFAMLGLRSANTVRVNFGLDPEKPFKFDLKSIDLEKIDKEDTEKTTSLLALVTGGPATVLVEGDNAEAAAADGEVEGTEAIGGDDDEEEGQEEYV